MDGVTPYKLLIFEDDEILRSMLVDFFSGQGATVATAANGQGALDRIEKEKPDVIILDMIMPIVDGWTTLRELRSSGNELPVLVLTDKGSVADRVNGLELGADDYLAKPFAPKELLSRVKALLRRVQWQRNTALSPPVMLQVKGLQLDPIKREASISGKGLLPLTKTEFDLLFFIAKEADRVFSHAQLMQEVLGYDPEVESRALSMHIANVRRKLDEVGLNGQQVIRTVSGAGYALVSKNLD